MRTHFIEWDTGGVTHPAGEMGGNRNAARRGQDPSLRITGR